MSKDAPQHSRFDIPRHSRIGIIAARFNEKIVDALLDGCRSRLRELGIDDSRIDLHRVPGAFELPVAAKMLIESERVHAVICLGCVIRGETPHFDFVAGEAARGIQSVAIETGVPVIFGVLTTNTEAQATERLVAGSRAAEAAMEMIALQARVRSG